MRGWHVSMQDLICFSILLYLLRTTIPFLKYPFALLFVSILIYTIFSKGKILFAEFLQFVKYFYIPIILFLIQLTSFLFTKKLYLIIFVDTINALTLLSIFFLLAVYIKSSTELIKMLDTLLFSFIPAAIILSFIILVNYFNFEESRYIASDYNFTLIPVFFGFLITFKYLFTNSPLLNRKFGYLLLVLFSFTFILAGSRRGLLIFLIIILSGICMILISLFSKNAEIKKNSRIIRNYLLLFGTPLVLLILFMFFSPVNFKKKLFGYLDIPARTYINFSRKIFTRYAVFNSDSQLLDFQKRIWSEVPDPRNPDSGWGLRKSECVYPLTGENSEILPGDCVGYKMDRNCNATFRDNCSYSFTDISLLFKGVKHGSEKRKYHATVFCFVSMDFDGSWAKLSAEGEVTGNYAMFYDLNRKGCWQKLDIDFECKGDPAHVYLYWAKEGVIDFSSLNGYIIFAYPVYGMENDSYIINLSLPEFQFHKVKYNQAGIISPLEINLEPDSVIPEFPIKKWLAQLLSSDSTYYPYRNTFALDSSSNDFINTRLPRWSFALKIFKYEYNYSQKFLGKGFYFLNWYGSAFLNDRNQVDWPHNPFLAILLYSGLFGLFIYCYFLIKSFSIFWKFRHVHLIFLEFSIITFVFSFFSSSGPFDPPVFGFLTILPFLIRYVHEYKGIYSK